MNIDRSYSDEKVKGLHDKYYGKHIKIRGMVGVCFFLGYNSNLPSWGLQVTVGRTPVQHVTPNELSLTQPEYPEAEPDQ